jgi:glucose-6-phosphate isomerase
MPMLHPAPPAAARSAAPPTPYQEKFMMSLVNRTPAWQALEQHWQEMQDRRDARSLRVRSRPRRDHAPVGRGTASGLLEEPHHRETLALLLDLAEAADLSGWIRRMFAGEPINNTEERAVLHVALRNRSNRPI